jgi:hypothetical protein
MTKSAQKTKPVRVGRLALDQTVQRRRDKTTMNVWQLHRHDGIAELHDDDGERLFVPFDELRRYWAEA